MSFKHIIVFLWLVVLPLAVDAQGKREKKANRTFRTLAYFNTGKPIDLYYKDGEEVKKLILPKMNLSPKDEVPTDREIVLGILNQ